ncbi:heterogeneous nuclear ribonucleoprotein A2 homolog 1 [Gouania willdenowi]|uniref:Heterogeneous nuclear ribonucleoprotein A2 homolog 1-like n=1 Tax=Gouania willdenowi TaxID=441366 RepID=A0A8C5HUI1_GOUWI|nr:heterogeneous nuclear ribonucleoprotein A2 homolog 1-like [Gouania willdenowi]
MTSDHMDGKSISNKRAYISLPKKYMAELASHYRIEHGIVITELINYLNEGYIQAYFREWGTVTSCKIRKHLHSGKQSSVAFVMFACETEADRADWAGPHCIGGMEVRVRRVISPREVEDSKEEAVPTKPHPRRSMGLGYILEDAQWLDDELKV